MLGVFGSGDGSGDGSGGGDGGSVTAAVVVAVVLAVVAMVALGVTLAVVAVLVGGARGSICKVCSYHLFCLIVAFIIFDILTWCIVTWPLVWAFLLHVYSCHPTPAGSSCS